MQWGWLLLPLLALAQGSLGYRILAIFPVPPKSHHFVYRPVLEELGRRGHEIVYLTAFPYQHLPPNITQISIAEHFAKALGDVNFNHVEVGELSVPMSLVAFHEIGRLMAEATMACPEVQRLVHSDQHFHAVIFESFFVSEYLSAFVHKFGAVGIEIMSLGDYSWVNEMCGLPDNTAYQIDFRNEGGDDLDFLGRLYNTYVSLASTIAGYFYLWRQEAFVQKHFNYSGSENRPSLFQLASNRSLVLSNSHLAVGYSVPLAPHRKEIGGINILPNKPLPKDLQKWLDESKDGVVYMSLGSNANVSVVASEELIANFMSVFSSLPQRVLLKWETEYPGKLPPNVKISSWFPQQDVLAHKNVALFITHGGLLSLNEAVHYGVPLVGIPFFGDQAKNLIFAERAGMGRLLRFRNLTEASIRWAVTEVLGNTRYKEEAARRSAMFRDRLVSPAQEAAYWVEYAIRHPNALTPRAAFLPFLVLHQLDILLVYLAVALAAAAISLKLSACCLRRLTRNTARKDKLKKS